MIQRRKNKNKTNNKTKNQKRRKFWLMVQKDFVISNKERSLSWDKPALVA